MSNYFLIKLSPPSSCGFSHFELQEKIKQHTGGRTHVSCSHAGSLWRACKSPAAPPPSRDIRGGVWMKFRVEREEQGERMGAMEWNEETKRGIRKEPVNYYRGPEFLRVRHVTEETDSGKTAAVLWSAVRKWKERESEGRDGERGLEWETARGGNRNKFLSNQFASPLRRSVEEDELPYLAAGASSTAWNLFSGEKHNDSTRKHRLMPTQTYEYCIYSTWTGAETHGAQLLPN